MKLTKLSAAWFPEWTCRLMPAPARSDAGTASQLIPGVRRTVVGRGMARTGAVLLATLAVCSCSGSAAERRAERDHMVARLVNATIRATESDLALVHHLRELLPGEEVPQGLLTSVGHDPVLQALVRWHGRVGDWEVEALQTTNDSQVGCVPWGTISAVSFSATRPNVDQAYDEWRARIAAMLPVPPQDVAPQSTWWPKGRLTPWYAPWLATVAVTGADQLTIELSCEEEFVRSRGRRTRS
jgi:hypothetical protein